MSDAQDILTTDASQRMLNYISPIYSQASNFLKIFDALGRQMQQANAWARELGAQGFAQTADWALPLWEAEYSISPLSRDAQARRAILLSKVRAFAAANPWTLAQKAAAVSGYGARVEENTARNAFAVFIRHCTADESAIRGAIDEIKPAHLIYTIKYEEYINCRAAAACGARYARKYRLTQLNA